MRARSFRDAAVAARPQGSDGGRTEICVTAGHVARAHAYVRTIRPPDIRGAAAQTLLMDVRTTTENERVEQDEDGREKEGLLTVCRLNVLGPLLNQLTYCLCGRQPLPCLHGTFLSTPPRAAAAAVVTPAHPAAPGGLA